MYNTTATQQKASRCLHTDVRSPHSGYVAFLQVWAFDPAHIGRGGCPERRVKFTDLFPMAPGSNETITGSIDAVFYSYKYHSLFMFHGETVYENFIYGSHENMLRKTSYWYQKWLDICDVL